MSLLFILLLELMAFVLFTTHKNVGLLFDVVLAECPISPDMIYYIFTACNMCKWSAFALIEFVE